MNTTKIVMARLEWQDELISVSRHLEVLGYHDIYPPTTTEKRLLSILIQRLQSLLTKQTSATSSSTSKTGGSQSPTGKPGDSQVPSIQGEQTGETE